MDADEYKPIPRWSLQNEKDWFTLELKRRRMMIGAWDFTVDYITSICRRRIWSDGSPMTSSMKNELIAHASREYKLMRKRTNEKPA